jgi:hypothetical protein
MRHTTSTSTLFRVQAGLQQLAAALPPVYSFYAQCSIPATPHRRCAVPAARRRRLIRRARGAGCIPTTRRRCVSPRRADIRRTRPRPAGTRSRSPRPWSTGTPAGVRARLREGRDRVPGTPIACCTYSVCVVGTGFLGGPRHLRAGSTLRWTRALPGSRGEDLRTRGHYTRNGSQHHSALYSAPRHPTAPRATLQRQCTSTKAPLGSEDAGQVERGAQSSPCTWFWGGQ